MSQQRDTQEDTKGTSSSPNSSSSTSDSNPAPRATVARPFAIFKQREAPESKRQQLMKMLDEVPEKQDSMDLELKLDLVDGPDDNELLELASDNDVFQDDFIQKAKDGVNLREYMKENEDELMKIEIDSIDDCMQIFASRYCVCCVLLYRVIVARELLLDVSCYVISQVMLLFHTSVFVLFLLDV